MCLTTTSGSSSKDNKNATVGDLIHYLEKFDNSMPLVQTNSIGWFNHDVKELSLKEMKRFIYKKNNATKLGKEVDGTFLVINDRMLCDY